MYIFVVVRKMNYLILDFRQLSFEFDLFAMGAKTFFTDENQTLEQYGLVPNATLGIRVKK